MAMTTARETGSDSATERSTETGTANTLLTTALTGIRRRVCGASVRYSATPTAAASTLSIKVGSTVYVIASGTVNTQNQTLVPAAGTFICLAADTIQIDAPAGGAGITASVVLITEPMA